MVMFTLTRESPLSPEELWARVAALADHAETVMTSRMRPSRERLVSAALDAREFVEELPGRVNRLMDAAVEALGTRHHVESHQLQIAGGVPLLNLRFLVEATEYSGENRQAVESAAMMRDAVERVALTGSLSVLRRSRGKWLPV